jgi:hypothetical protein
MGTAVSSPCSRLAVPAALLGAAALAGLPPPAIAQPSPQSSFFVTSVGNGAAAGDYDGLAGADARCQSLADLAGIGAPRIWRAYLSTAPIPGVPGGLVHARDRIGAGPWYNVAGEEVAADLGALHADGIDASLVLTETGLAVPGAEHDILTGSWADGTAIETFPGNPDAPGPTCFNWTSNAADVYGWVGHADWFPGQSWNSQHEVLCDEAGLNATAGTGRLYCFAPGPPAGIFADGFESGGTGNWLTSP